MIKLLIVDDEENTRDVLKKYIQWNKLGIDVVETAKNGLAALELTEQMQPDIVLCDIRMPKMDGIEFATRLRDRYPDCKIIFLSGYSDKEYLKSAIQLKALNYIEKPVNFDEIKSVVKNAVSLCLKEAEARSLKDKMLNNLLESTTLIRQEMALQLIKDNSNISEFVEKYGDPFLNNGLNEFYTAISIMFNWRKGISQEEMNSFQNALIQAFYDGTHGDPSNFICGFSGNDTMVLIIRAIFNSLTDAISNPTVGHLMKYFNSISNGQFSVSIGVGPSVNKINNLPNSYRLASEAIKKQFYLGAGRIYYFDHIENSYFSIDENSLSNFRNHLKHDNKTEASNLIIQIADKAKNLKDNDINHVKNVFFHILSIIFDVAREKKFIEPDKESEKDNIWHQIYLINTLNELTEYTLSILDVIFSCLEEKGDTINRRIYEVTKYIRENYSAEDLTIQSIASHVYLSQSYMCSLFKKYKNMTLNEYIKDIRMEKAKELLQNNKIKLYEVATNVGFSDPNYFSTIFKKHVGCTPSEFREKYYV